MNVIGYGIDLVEIARIAEMVQRHGQRFLDRCFTQPERAYCDEGVRNRFQRLAARFAAKEAALKAIGTGWRDGIAWTDVEVVRDPSGLPRLLISGQAAQVARDLGITAWHLSLSHTDTHAIAGAIASGPESA